MGGIALITGASAGLGAEFARQLHASGYSVLLAARREDRLKTICAELNSLRPGSAEYVVCDLEAQDKSALLDFLAGRSIDVLINNAGRGSFGRFDELSEDGELSLVRLNIEGFLSVLRLVIPGMKARRSGKILNVSSISAMQPVPFMATYAASKAFNLWHSLALREELRSFGVSVTALCPGPTATEFGSAAKVPGDRISFDSASPTGVVAEALKAMGRGRAYVVPTMRAKFVHLLTRICPIGLRTRVLGLMLAGAADRPV